LNARGFSLIEFVVVIVIVGLSAGLALDRLLPIIGRAERVAFMQVQSQLRDALLLEAAERITRGESNTLIELSGINPMSLLLSPPANYLGSEEWLDSASMPAASWFFDEHNARLVYKVGEYTRFDPLNGLDDRVELQVRFVFRDRDGDGVFGPSHDHFDGLRLESVHSFAWPD